MGGWCECVVSGWVPTKAPSFYIKATMLCLKLLCIYLGEWVDIWKDVVSSRRCLLPSQYINVTVLGFTIFAATMTTYSTHPSADDAMLAYIQLSKYVIPHIMHVCA